MQRTKFSTNMSRVASIPKGLHHPSPGLIRSFLNSCVFHSPELSLVPLDHNSTSARERADLPWGPRHTKFINPEGVASLLDPIPPSTGQTAVFAHTLCKTP